MLKLDQDEIKSFYNKVPNVWGNGDAWHVYSKSIITAYIRKKKIFTNSILLNAGSAGNAYNIECNKMYHVDIADKKLKGIENAVIASIEQLPFTDCFFDDILCVGSVLNYCDALKAISELSRVIKPDGNLILEYESSYGFEYLFKECYKKDACIISAEYIEKQHKQWLYSPQYIKNILNSYNFTILSVYPFHIADGFLSKFMKEETSISLTKIDVVLNKLPFFKEHGNNIILHCKKI